MLEMIFFMMAPLTPPPSPPMELPENRYGLVARKVEFEEENADGSVRVVFLPALSDDANGEIKQKIKPHGHKAVWNKVVKKIRRFKRTGVRNH